MLKFLVFSLTLPLTLSKPQRDTYGAPYSPPQSTYDSYSAPAPAPSYSAPAPSYNAPTVQLPPLDYYKHETHHYYHAGPPKVVHVPVAVTQKPYVVHVPQNVPVNFVPVQVPTQPPPQIQYVQQPVQYAQYGGSFEDPYVKRKELARSTMLSLSKFLHS